MFKRVLTATHLLEACDAVVLTAMEIAAQDQGKLFILHVLEPSYFHECGPLETVRHFRTGEEIASSPEYREAVKNALDEKCGGALKPYGNYQIDISYGRPSVEIRRWARKFNADLIVVGSHAAKIEEGYRGNLIGDVVEDVIMHANVPVMVVNRLYPKERLNFKQIMICVDFSQSSSYAADFTTQLARKFDAKLHVFHLMGQAGTATGKTSGDRAAIDRKLREFCRFPEEIQQEYVIYEGAQPSPAILQYSLAKEIDLIVMGSHTTVEDNRWYVGSTVEEVTAKSSCPVAVVSHSAAMAKTGS
jgi:nucleotide-binding universal stress UspA family protein